MNTLQSEAVAVIPETEMPAITQNDLRIVLLEAAALNASAAEIRRRMEAGARIEPGKLGAYCDRKEEIVDSAPESLTHFGLEVGPVEMIQECGEAFVAHATEKGCPERFVYGPKEKPAETVAPEEPRRQTYVEYATKNGCLPPDFSEDHDLELERIGTMLCRWPRPWAERGAEYARILDIALGSASWIGPCLTEILDAVKEAHDSWEPVPPGKILGIVGRYNEWRIRTHTAFMADPL